MTRRKRREHGQRASKRLPSSPRSVRLGGVLQPTKGLNICSDRQLQETQLPVLWSPGQHWSSLCANWNLEMCNRISWTGKGSYLCGGHGLNS